MALFDKFSEMDAKTRVLIVFGTIIGLSVAGFFAVRHFSGDKTTGGSRVAGAPSNLQSIPGGQLSSEYYRALAEANAQRSKQAQMTGGSAVPTLINVPTQQNTFEQPAQSCTVMCPNPDNPDVTNDLNDLVKGGKLSQKDADVLLGMEKSNVPIAQFQDQLNELVKAGKLTPEQARKLLEDYKKQHMNALLASTGKTMDALIKNGQLPLDEANQLLALQKSGISSNAYAAEVNELVKAGKISPETAQQLIAQYQQQQADEATKASIYGLHQLAKSGAITQDVANRLAELQKSNVPVDAYAAELQRLVAEGKLTPAEAAKLLEEYKAKRASLGATDALNAYVKKQSDAAAAELADLVKGGKISQSTADLLAALQNKDVSPEDYKKALDELVKEGKLTPDEAARLMATYNKLHAAKAEAARLLQMQTNNASAQDYANELKRAVAAGTLTPDDATSLMQEYQSMTAIPTAIPTAQANLPGNADFQRLAEQVQAATQTGAAPTAAPAQNAQFSQAQAQAELAAQQAEQQRIQQIQSAMSGQAQALIAAWAPPKMVHQGGAVDLSKKEEGAGLQGQSLLGGKSTANAASSAAAVTTRPIIKTGTILYAVLDTAVNSDYPDTPVMVTIVQGPFKGAKLLGKLNLAQGKDKVSLNFNMMDMQDWPKTKSVNAFAIDPDTARTVMATDVDYHYMKRYGTLFATSFLTGYSNAITQAGTSTTGIFGTSSTHNQLSPGSKIAVGLGQVGTQFTSSLANNINTPTTVQVKAGVALGILFMSDVT